MSLKDELQNFMNSMAVSYSAGDAVACAAMFTANVELFPPMRQLPVVEQK
jgi:hypothetical protein